MAKNFGNPGASQILAYHPPGGDDEFHPCDGIAFDGLTKSNRPTTFLDGSSNFENYYSVKIFC